MHPTGAAEALGPRAGRRLWEQNLVDHMDHAVLDLDVDEIGRKQLCVRRGVTVRIRLAPRP